jgi:peptide/nickel transport system substrate-binding protein
VRFVAALAIVLALVGCGRAGEVRAEPHVLRIADSVDPSSLNPLLAHDQETIGYDLLWAQTLVGLSASNQLVPVLVTRVPSLRNGDISRDGRTIVYHLRHGVRFADGVELTSADVAFTFHAILDPRSPVESQVAYRSVSSLQTPDRYTVVVHLRKRWSAAVAQLFAQADFAFGILPAHAFTSTDVTRGAWNALPFGTGPFRVVKWERANRIVLEPNPYYRPHPALTRIVFVLIPTMQASLIALRAGNVDLTRIEPPLVPGTRGLRGARVVVTAMNGLDLLMLQTRRPPTNDVHVRRAIGAAIDRQEIVRASFGTLTAADSFLPPVFSWHDPAPNALSADPARVTQELSEDGWQRVNGWWRKDGRELSVTIDFAPEGGSWLELVEQEQLRRAGIDAQIKPFPTSLFNAPDGPLRSGTFTAAAAVWIGAADPEQSVIFACSQRGSNGNNSMNYCNTRFDALFEDQAVTGDPIGRRRDFIEMQRIVRSDVPAVPVAFLSNIDVVSDRVAGFRRNMLMYPVDADRWDVR